MSVIDKLRVLWAICLVAHYRENNKQPSPANFIAEFGEEEWRYWKIACEVAHYYKLLDINRMQLTPKGIAACNKWQQTSERLCSI